jgi:hypothetical protein
VMTVTGSLVSRQAREAVRPVTTNEM